MNRNSGGGDFIGMDTNILFVFNIFRISMITRR